MAATAADDDSSVDDCAKSCYDAAAAVAPSPYDPLTVKDDLCCSMSPSWAGVSALKVHCRWTLIAMTGSMRSSIWHDCLSNLCFALDWEREVAAVCSLAAAPSLASAAASDLKHLGFSAD